LSKPLAWQPGNSLQELEREALVRTLEKFQGNRTHAAQALGLSLPGIRNKIRRFDIAAPEKPRGQPRRGK
jgi:DNA-binding NtrC family response regulator